MPPDQLRGLFKASPGAVVAVLDGDAVTFRRVGTITPKVRDSGWCVFYERGCRIHPVAPFGCSHFDMHMDGDEGQRRSQWHIRAIDGDAAYARLRESLTQQEETT